MYPLMDPVLTRLGTTTYPKLISRFVRSLVWWSDRCWSVTSTPLEHVLHPVRGKRLIDLTLQLRVKSGQLMRHQLLAHARRRRG